MHTIEKEKKEMEEEKEKQRLAEEHRKSSQADKRVHTGQSSAPPPSPAAAMSPVGSTGLLEETLLVTRPASVASRAGSNVEGPSEANINTAEPAHASPGDNVPGKSNEVTEDSAIPSGEVLDENRPRSSSEVQTQRSVSPRPGASVEQNLEKRVRASSLKSAPHSKNKSRTPSPREGGKGKKSSSAKD